MPTYDTNILPSTTGLTLGNSIQRWSAYLEDVNAQGSFVVNPVTNQPISVGGAIYVSTVPVTVSTNTTSLQTLATFTIPAGLLNAVGKVIRFTLAGIVSTQSGQTPQMNFVISAGGVSFLDANTQAVTDGADNYTWRITGESAVSLAGSAAFFYRSNMIMLRPTSAVIDWQETTVGPIDLTVNETVTVSVAFSTNTSPANTCTLQHMVVEVLN